MKNLAFLRCALGASSALFLALPGCIQDVDAVETEGVVEPIRVENAGSAGGTAVPGPRGPIGTAGRPSDEPEGPGGRAGAGGAASGAGGAASGSGGAASGAAGSPTEPPVPTQPALVATGLAGTLAVDDTTLFIGTTGNVPYRVAKAGGTPERLADGSAQPAGSVQLLSLDATHAYWSVYTGITNNQGLTGYTILRAAKAGGPVSAVTSVKGPNFAVPAAIAVDDEWVYLTQPDIYNGNVPPELLVGAVRRVPKAGGPAQDLSANFSYVVAVDTAHVFWARPTVGGAQLIQADKDGANAQVFAQELGTIGSIASRGDRLYWTVSDAGSYLLRSAAPGQAPVTIATSNTYFGVPAGAPDAAYFLRPGGASTGKVLRASLQGQVTELATAPAASTSPVFYGTYGNRIAVDDTAVYWSYEGDVGGASRVFRLAR
ncbi:MAG: hypothetical protein MUF34_22705 [Polyangiaceae bacterium]|nr:hypothetical protein [Polyangiaceae bacterium]